MKTKFAFILHPLRRDDILEVYPFFRLFPFLAKNYNFKDVARKLSPKKFIDFTANLSITDKSASGLAVFCPIFPEDFVKLEERVALNKVKQGCLLAERHGAGIIGLGGFTSIIGNEGEVLAKEINAGITSGNTYTAYLVLEGIFKAAKLMDIELSSATATVIGATGDIGSICTKVLAKKVKQVNLVARNEKRLAEFAQELKICSSALVQSTKNLQEAIKNADIILTATSSLTTIIEPLQLKSGCIVCDVALPANIAREVYSIRQDVLVFEGGKAKVPKAEKVKNKLWQKYFSDGIIFGCLAETILLALEDYYQDFSIGRGNITEEKLDFIGKISRKHGFSLAPFKCGNKVLDEKEIAIIKNNISKLSHIEEGEKVR